MSTKTRIAIIMALITILGALVCAAPTAAFAEAANLNAVVKAVATITTGTINYDGEDIGLEAYITYNGKQYPAFCIDPVLSARPRRKPLRSIPAIISGRETRRLLRSRSI
jgi:hypothetical protein